MLANTVSMNPLILLIPEFANTRNHPGDESVFNTCQPL
jgi:hypothetical protein